MNKLLNRLVDDISVLVGDAEVIVVRKTCKAEFSFGLFLVAVDISSRYCVHKRIKTSLPYAPIGKVVEWRKHNGGVCARRQGKGKLGFLYDAGNWRSGECDMTRLDG